MSVERVNYTSTSISRLSRDDEHCGALWEITCKSLSNPRSYTEDHKREIEAFLNYYVVKQSYKGISRIEAFDLKRSAELKEKF